MVVGNHGKRYRIAAFLGVPSITWTISEQGLPSGVEPYGYLVNLRNIIKIYFGYQGLSMCIKVYVNNNWTNWVKV